MKKILSLALLGLALSANAQQVNGDFDATWEACYPLGSKANFQVDTEPYGWQASNVQGMKGTGKKTVVTQVTGRNGNGYAVCLTNKTTGFSSFSSVVPAYISLGTPWSTSVGSKLSSTSDGGTFGGIDFAYHPDALKLYYQKTNASGSSQPSTVVAYLWNGTFTQNEVPYTIVLTGTPAKMTMTDRDRQVLNKSFDGCQGGTRTDNGTLVASLEKSITANTADGTWDCVTIDFTYNTATTLEPQKLNIIISANDYFGIRDNNVENDKLVVDDVTLIYRSQLNSIKYNNTPISGFDKDTYSYAVLGEWTDGCLTSTSNGKGATQSGWSYDPATQTATNTITGEGEDENGETTHTYTVKFVNLSLASITYKEGTAEAQSLVATKDNHYYVFAADYSEGCLSAIPNSSTANVSVTQYNEETRVATLTVSEAGYTEDFYVKFAKKDVNAYSGKMFIDCESLGGVIGISSRGVNGVSSVEISQKDGNNNVDFQLSNFYFGGPLGNIYVTNVPYNENGNVVSLYKEQTITIFGEGGAELGELPVVLNGTIQDGQLTATIDIDWSDIPIQVKIYPLNTSSMDLSEYTLMNTAEEITEDITNPNCLVYVKEGSEYSANNFVVGSTCENFTLTEGQAFDAPKAFTATKVTYNRTLSAGNVQTFVLPFSFTPGENDVVAALESVEDNVLTFKRIEGPTEANKPYLIQTDNASALASFDNVNIEPTTGDLTTTVNGVSHIGSYSELTVTNAYGYAGGQFVKAGTGTVKPFRTYITIPAGSAAAPKAFDIHFADTETGIATVVTDSKDQNVYNLQGVRVAKSLNGLTKGIYIVNGKKTVIK